MDKDTALDLALEALESATPKYTRQRKDQKTLGGALDYWKLEQHHRLKAITAIKQARSAPTQEHQINQLEKFKNHVLANAYALGVVLDAPAAPVQEHDEWLTGCPECGMDSGCDCDSGTWNPPAQPAPASWMDMVTANLVREGVNKHKARELAEHFYSLKENT